MRRGRIIIYLALLLIVGVVGIIVVPRLMSGEGLGGQKTSVASVPTATPVEMVEILVVAQAIPLGAPIDAAYLSTVSFPRTNLVEGLYMTDVAEAVGRRARFDLLPGVILNKSYLADTADQVSSTVSEAGFFIKPGMVAVSIPITRLSSISYAPQRGDHVNVIVTLLLVDLDVEFQSITPDYTAGVIAPGPSILLGGGVNTNELQRNLAAQIAGGGTGSEQGRMVTDPLLEQNLYLVPSENQRPRLVSQTLIQDVMVLQIGNFEKPVGLAPAPKPGAAEAASPTPSPTPAVTAAGTQVPVRPDVITLVVSPQDAVTLNYLIYAGAQLTLALRPVGDSTTVQTQAVTLSFLLDTYNISRPVKLDIGIQPRLDTLTAPSLPNDVIPTPSQR